MGLLQENNVLYYHPLDSLMEYTQSIDWTGNTSNIVSGIFVSGFRAIATSNPNFNVTLSPDYGNINSSEHITVAFWTSGFFQDTSQTRYVNAYFGSTSDFDRNGLSLRRSSLGSYKPRIGLIVNTNNSDAFITSYPLDNDLHFVVLDVTYEPVSNGWRHRISIDGSGWQNLGVYGYDGTPTTNQKAEIRLNDTTGGTFILDEMIVWSSGILFTDQELSNLYELGNTYNQTMNNYTNIFGTPTNSGINCFIEGYILNSGNITLYIPSQKEVKSSNLFTKGSIQISGNPDFYISGSPPIASSSTTLFIIAPTPFSGSSDFYTVGPLLYNNNSDQFIWGYQIFSGSINQYMEGHLPFSGSNDLYVFGAYKAIYPINLYIQGPLQSNNNLDYFIWGHLPYSGDTNLYIKGHLPDTNVFICVSDNNPSRNINLYTRGIITSGAIYYTNNDIVLFIQNSGEIGSLYNYWSGFTKVADAELDSYSGIWQSFVRVGNTDYQSCNLYINSHASGSNPHGILINDSFISYISGRSAQTGDEGLLSDGFNFSTTDYWSFAKVHLGINNSMYLYISGSIPTVQSSSITNLFTFGVFGISSSSCVLYSCGKSFISKNTNLFILGIQDIKFDSVPLYLEVTTLGSLNNNRNAYIHGF